jgi:hypothetical protein
MFFFIGSHRPSCVSGPVYLLVGHKTKNLIKDVLLTMVLSNLQFLSMIYHYLFIIYSNADEQKQHV